MGYNVPLNITTKKTSTVLCLFTALNVISLHGFMVITVIFRVSRLLSIWSLLTASCESYPPAHPRRSFACSDNKTYKNLPVVGRWTVTPLNKYSKWVKIFPKGMNKKTIFQLPPTSYILGDFTQNPIMRMGLEPKKSYSIGRGLDS